MELDHKTICRQWYVLTMQHVTSYILWAMNITSQLPIYIYVCVPFWPLYIYITLKWYFKIRIINHLTLRNVAQQWGSWWPRWMSAHLVTSRNVHPFAQGDMFGDFQQQKLGFHQQSLGFPSANFRTQQSKVMLSGCDWYWFLFFCLWWPTVVRGWVLRVSNDDSQIFLDLAMKWSKEV